MRLREEAQGPGGWHSLLWRQAKDLLLPFVLIIVPGAVAYWLTHNVLFLILMFAAYFGYAWWLRRERKDRD